MRKLPPRMQDKLYHDLIMPEETAAIRSKVRRFAEKEIAPYSHQIANLEESKDNFPREIFNKLAKEDIFKIPFPKDVGGLGLNYPCCAAVATIEELSYISNSIGALYDVQAILFGNALNKYGSRLLKDKYLIPVLSGEKLGCFATTEPEASSDLSINALKTTAVKNGNEYIVNGQKRFITNACVSDYVITLVNIEGKMGMLLIELDSNGCRVGEPDKKMGNRGQLTSDIYLKNVKVPVENLVGEEDRGLHVALGTLSYGRVGIAASGVGMAQSAFDESVMYMKQREVFGKKIANYQYWQFLLAERAIQIENARNLYSKAALRMDKSTEFAEPESAGAKYYGTKCAVDMARDALQIFGGYGYMKELSHDGSTYKVEEIYRDSKITEIYEGTNEIQKLIIARTIFGRDIEI